MLMNRVSKGVDKIDASLAQDLLNLFDLLIDNSLLSVYETLCGVYLCDQLLVKT